MERTLLDAETLGRAYEAILVMTDGSRSLEFDRAALQRLGTGVSIERQVADAAGEVVAHDIDEEIRQHVPRAQLVWAARQRGLNRGATFERIADVEHAVFGKEARNVVVVAEVDAARVRDH